VRHLRAADARLAGKGIPLYRCTGRNGFAPRPCPTPQRMPAEKLETIVWETVASVLRDPTRLRGPMVRYQDRLGVDAVEVTSEAEHLRRQLTALDRQERRLLDLYLRDDSPVPAGVARDRVEVFRRQRADLQARLTAAQARQAAQTAAQGPQEAIRAGCEVAARGLDRLTLEGRRELLGTLLDAITVVESAIIIEGGPADSGPRKRGANCAQHHGPVVRGTDGRAAARDHGRHHRGDGPDREDYVRSGAHRLPGCREVALGVQRQARERLTGQHLDV
jgi:hypothetical protein